MRIIALLLTVFSVFGADDPNYAKPFELVYDYDFLCAVRLYADGQLLKEYQTNEIVLIGPAKSNRFANTYAITVPAMARRDEPVTFTCTLFVRNGTNVVESIVNNPLQISLRPPTPEPLRVYRPIDDDAEIERVATAATLTTPATSPTSRCSRNCSSC